MIVRYLEAVSVACTAEKSWAAAIMTFSFAPNPLSLSLSKAPRKG